MLEKIKKPALYALATLGTAAALFQAVACSVPGGEAYCVASSGAIVILDNVSAAVDKVEE